MQKFISWRRVSTKKQGRSGLGLEAQSDIINYFVSAENGRLIADYAEVYTGKDLSGCTELKKAIAHAKSIGAILIIAKTDRFRNTIEALQVYEDMGDGNIMFCDLPHTDKFTLTLFFALAEREALLVSVRTKKALEVSKNRGVKSGRANPLYGNNPNDTRTAEERAFAREHGELMQKVNKNKASLLTPEKQALLKLYRQVVPQLNAASIDGEMFWINWRRETTRVTKEHHRQVARLITEFDASNGLLPKYISDIRLKCIWNSTILSIKRYNELNEQLEQFNENYKHFKNN